MVGITLSAILSFLGCVFLLKSENKSFTPKIIVKKEEYKTDLLVTFLGVIGITYLGNFALSIVLIICYLAITKDFKKSILVKESKEISISTFFLNTSTFIKFWPIIFMASIFFFSYFFGIRTSRCSNIIKKVRCGQTGGYNYFRINICTAR